MMVKKKKLRMLISFGSLKLVKESEGFCTTFVLLNREKLIEMITYNIFFPIIKYVLCCIHNIINYSTGKKEA